MPHHGSTHRPKSIPQGHMLFHPLDGIPLPASAAARSQNRHRTHRPDLIVQPPSHAIARLVGVVLLAAAALKLLALGMPLPSLESPHPLLPWLPAGQVVLLAAIMEAAAGLGTLVSRRQGLVLAAPSMCLATLSGYRAIATWANLESPCDCLGPIALWLRWNPATERSITLWALLGCLVLMTAAWWSHLRNGAGTVHGPLAAHHRPPA